MKPCARLILRSFRGKMPSDQPRPLTQFERRQRTRKAAGVMLVAGRMI